MRKINDITFLLFYRLYQKHNDFNARFSSILLLTIIYAFYFMAILFSVEYFLGKDITPAFSGTYKKEKGMLVVIVLMLPTYLFLNRIYRAQQLDKLVSGYNTVKITSLRNILLILSFIILPFIVMTLVKW